MPPVISTLERQLEQIRRSHLARNQSSLRKLNSIQLEGVQHVTAAITAAILQMAAVELERAAAERRSDMSDTSRTISVLFHLDEEPGSSEAVTLRR